LFKFIKVYLYSMSENQLSVIKDAQALVTDLLTNKLSKSIRFHTLQHTQEVVAACELLSRLGHMSEDDRYALLLAAWFHDTGYTGGEAKDHESLSIQLATEFLNAHGATEELKAKITGLINATRMPQTPDNPLQQIICDADLFHLGTEGFKEKNRLLRDELVEFGHHELSKKDWRRINIRFLENHTYFTAYAKEKLEPVKDQHLAELKEKEEKNTDTMKPEKEKPKEKPKEKADKGKDAVAKEKETAEQKAKREKEKEADRSIATVFRIMAQSHTGLSQMADSKANILISVNSIILSIIISALYEKLQTDRYMQLPVGLIVLVCVASIVFGILATRPTVSSGTFTRDDIAAKRTNLLFFGNFHNMSLEDYNWGMMEMLGDKYYMNSSMIKDNYFLGVVLAKKYRYLRIAYNVFMYGLIISIIAFVVAFMMPEATEMYTAG
jgi:predicted metal-dependent HD superfamily phosphohydrolase